VEEAMRKCAALGLGVVRGWACHDDPNNPATMQTEPLQYSEAGLAGIDIALESAARHGLKVVLSLVNYWSDYGGIPQYLRWHGLDPEQPALFFRDGRVRAHFRAHIERILRRTNPRTGLAWGDDPAVLGWELCNEPRGVGLRDDGSALVAWVREMAQVVGSASQQLVLTGEEGLGDDLAKPYWHSVGAGWQVTGTGMDFGRNTAAVDLGSIHLYPEHWGWNPEQMEEAGVAWIQQRAAAARAVERPVVLGEFGLSNAGLSVAERRRLYRVWMEAARREPNVCGVLSWSFSTDDRPDDWDDYTWYYREETSPEDTVNRMADLHRDEALRWSHA